MRRPRRTSTWWILQTQTRCVVALQALPARRAGGLCRHGAEAAPFAVRRSTPRVGKAGPRQRAHARVSGQCGNRAAGRQAAARGQVLTAPRCAPCTCAHVRAQKVHRLENVVGWYHSHPGYGCWLSGIDCSTQMLNQQFQVGVRCRRERARVQHTALRGANKLLFQPCLHERPAMSVHCVVALCSSAGAPFCP